MKALALIESPNHVCYRYRVEAFAWALAGRGIELEALPLGHGLASRMRCLAAARHADVVILQRKLLPLWQLRLLRRLAPRLIYDVDDALFQRDSYSRKGPDSWARLMGFWATVYAADAVTVGNSFLKSRADAYVDSRKVHVVPTCIDPARYTMARHKRGPATARLVWIGQRSTLPSLDLAREHLALANRRLPGLELRVICDHSPELEGVSLTRRTWSSDSETAELADADIGVNWLPDESWSRGKCGLKVLQYMAAGLPVVANPVGMNREMIIHGQTGLLASTPDEWARAIGRLASSPKLRQQMGQRGRRLVEQRFGVERWAPRFADIIEQVARFGSVEPAGEPAVEPSLDPVAEPPSTQAIH
ncbi:MAG: glycosyltransferase family 4 protein [Planctomycetota bacterium]|nr:glycosyltransferase family 4 protein [Planctomycetota bacterium]